MRKEVSSGGVVVFRNTVLLLKKFNGDWVLPKGRVEEGESLLETALREVKEETDVDGRIIYYIDKINYRYRNIRDGAIVSKSVHWYYMKTSSMKCRPLKSEGFVLARFVHRDKALKVLRYRNEKRIIKKMLKLENKDR